MAELQLFQGEANPNDVRLRFYATGAAASSTVGTVVVQVPVASAVGKAGVSVSVGTVTMFDPIAAAHGNGTGSAALVTGGVGEIDITVPAATARGKASATAAGATVTLAAPAGSGAVVANARVTVTLATVTATPPAALAHAGRVTVTGRVPTTCMVAPLAVAKEYKNAHLETTMSETGWSYETWLSK